MNSYIFVYVFLVPKYFTCTNLFIDSWNSLSVVHFIFVLQYVFKIYIFVWSATVVVKLNLLKLYDSVVSKKTVHFPLARITSVMRISLTLSNSATIQKLRLTHATHKNTVKQASKQTNKHHAKSWHDMQQNSYIWKKKLSILKRLSWKNYWLFELEKNEARKIFNSFLFLYHLFWIRHNNE